MKVKVKYDLEDNGEVLSMEEVGVKEIIEVPDNVEEDEIADWISNKTGWCVFKWERISLTKLYKIVSVEATKNHYGLGLGMKDMIGEFAELLPPTESRKSFTYKGFTWRYEDVVELTIPENNHDPVLFDPQNLTGA